MEHATATTTRRSTSCSSPRARPATRRSAPRSSSELQAILQADVPYAFLHHTIDITGFSNDVQGYVPIPEMRYLETVWLDGETADGETAEVAILGHVRPG